jgi:hypothetical protein
MITVKAMLSARFKSAFFKTDFFHSLRELIGYPWHEPHWKPSDPKGKVSPAAQGILEQARSYALLAMESRKQLPDEDSSAIYRQKLYAREINYIFGRHCEEREMHTLRALAVAGSWHRLATKLRCLDPESSAPRDLWHFSRKTITKCSRLLRQRLYLCYTRFDAEHLEILNLLHFPDDEFWLRRDDPLPPPEIDHRGLARI